MSDKTDGNLFAAASDQKLYAERQFAESHGKSEDIFKNYCCWICLVNIINTGLWTRFANC